MSDPRIDNLAESARNRGLKLVRSRIRTPGERGFGKVGLTDAAGNELLGMTRGKPSAKPEEIADYLRNLDAKDWGASLDVAVLPRKRKPKKPATAAADDTAPPAPASPPEPEPQPKPQIRDAQAGDAARLVELIRYLGHPIDEEQVRKNLAMLKRAGETPLVAMLDKKVVGLCGISRRIVIHRPAPLGRITVLVVAQEAQGQSLGRMLVEAAEAWMRKGGCQLVEVTSNDRRAEAHAFYRHLGFERTSMRFVKTL